MLGEVVTSSSIRSLGYDARTQTLEVELVSGAVYRDASVHSGHFRHAGGQG
jgi:KTSC domain